MKTYTNFKKIFLVRVFWLKYIFQIKFKSPILDLMLLPKNSVPFKGSYYSSLSSQAGWFEHVLNANQEVRFSCDKAHIKAECGNTSQKHLCT